MRRFNKLCLLLLLFFPAYLLAENVRDDSAYMIITKIYELGKEDKFFLGSGTAVHSNDETTKIITANHVVLTKEDIEKPEATISYITMNFNSERITSAEIVARDIKNDMAMLKINAPKLPFAKLGKKPNFGIKYHISCYLSQTIGVTLYGHFIGHTIDETHPNWPLFMIGAHEGASGSGILDEEGNLSGVVTNIVVFPNSFVCNASPPYDAMVDFIKQN